MGAGNPLQCSVLHVQADGESSAFCVLVCVRLREGERRDCMRKISCGEVVLLCMQEIQA